MRTTLMSMTIAALVGIAAAQSGGGYDLSWWTIDGGGITFATGGSFDLGGTIGQPDATSLNALTGGAFTLTGGFWFVSCIATNGDADGNGCVDDADLLTVLFNFGATGFNLADVNCDAIVDDADLLIVLFNFGSGC
ncbi:MAG: hypothetical protein KatS3mg019_0333 [Fimbriimonadales bacterium]|nr:MAG: hypothetical protein KatS3mg019_0333 [Fimbriimonadales bacterium]